MRIAQKQTHTKRNITISIVASIIVAGLIYAWFSPDVSFFGLKTREVAPENTVDYNKATNDQKVAGETQKKTTASSDTDTKPESKPNESSDFTEAPVSFSVTALNVTENTVQIRTLIDTIGNSGECTLTLEKGDVIITKRSSIYAGPSSSTCEGFDVPVSELSPGEWKLDIVVDIKGQKANVTRLITI